jgi:hypothetical protein
MDIVIVEILDRNIRGSATVLNWVIKYEQRGESIICWLGSGDRPARLNFIKDPLSDGKSFPE